MIEARKKAFVRTIQYQNSDLMKGWPVPLGASMACQIAWKTISAIMLNRLNFLSSLQLVGFRV